MFKPVTPQVDFPKLERELLEHWYKSGIVKKYLEKNKSSKKKFSFLDGPITANNPMGVHHAWGRTYKDLWQRFWNMKGAHQRFQNGFDCQGLWVEVEVEKELGFKNKRDIEEYGIDKFVEKCQERVLKFAKIQTEQSKRLGYFMDWDNSYFTMSDENNYWIWHFLKVCHEKGYLYKGRDTVPWCPRCGTAISQHEILTEEYQELTHETVYFKLPIKGRKNESFLVWTTTPWTILANVALGVNPSLAYGVWQMENGEKLILAKKAADSAGVKGKRVKTFKGKEVIGLEYDGPFDNLPAVKEALRGYTHRVIDGGEVVTEDEGTGILHVAPGAGEEDARLAREFNLPIIAPINEDATYYDGFGQFSGKNAKENPELIIGYLKEKDNGRFFYKEDKVTHRYPTCWRCKTELVWRSVDEWYIAMDKPSNSKLPPKARLAKGGKTQNSKNKSNTLRKQMIEVAKKINWRPEWGLERELDWLKNMHDWLISKKRYWGLALPIYECEKCGNFEVIGGKEELKKRAVSGWKKFEGHSPHRPWVDEVKIECLKCGEVVSRIKDVGNPWLDAGIVPFSTMPQDWFPADFITESFPGQFKNWFYSLIAMSTVLKNTNPFRTILGFATLLGEDGRPMHKSWGNAIEFNEGADKIGVDVMRWMYVTHDPENNLLFGHGMADQTRRRFHLMFWNIYNFFITYANVDRWKPIKSQISKNVLDRWILSRLNKTIKVVTESLEEYDAYAASNAIESFVNDFSLWYVRRSRDRVGPAADNSIDKNDCLTTLYTVLVTLSKLLAPFTPFIAEEIYKNLTNEESVHLADWPKVDKKAINIKLEEEMNQARKVVELAHAQRKAAGIKVRQPLSSLSNVTPMLLSEEIEKIIAAEVNVKKVKSKQGKDILVELKTAITPKLKAEGEAREIVRKIQEERKKLGTRLDEKIEVVLENWPAQFENYIKRKASVQSLTKGKELRVLKV